jgi:hypothetical protein
MNYRVDRDNFKDIFEKVKTNDVIHFRDISFEVQKTSSYIKFSIKGKRIISIIVISIAITFLNAFIGYFINFYIKMGVLLYVASTFVAGVFSEDITRFLFKSQITKFSNICERWNNGENNNNSKKCKLI